MFWDCQRAQTQSCVEALQSLRKQMDVRFCRVQKPIREAHLCSEHPGSDDLRALQSVPWAPMPSLDTGNNPADQTIRTWRHMSPQNGVFGNYDSLGILRLFQLMTNRQCAFPDSRSANALLPKDAISRVPRNEVVQFPAPADTRIPGRDGGSHCRSHTGSSPAPASPLAKSFVHLTEPVRWNRPELLVQGCGLHVP